MKFLMLNPPFLLRDLLRPEVRYIDIILYIGQDIVLVIAPENCRNSVCRYRVLYSHHHIGTISSTILGTITFVWYRIWHPFLQIDIINNEICNAKRGVLHGKTLIDDPIKSIVEGHVSMLAWHMQSRKFGMTAIQLKLLQQKSIEVLESL